MTILIVEDNAKMRSYLKSIIMRHFPNLEMIYECEDEQNVIETLTEFHPDWVLMDINLKATNGLILTRKITTLDPAAKVIIVTQYDEPAYREIASNVGTMGYVLKDNIHEIFDVMRKVN